MLDLKAKLAAAGLISEEELARERKRGGRPSKAANPSKRAKSGKPGKPAPRLDVTGLRDKSRGEQYDAVRRFVDAVRLDPLGRTPSEQARSFHFAIDPGPDASAGTRQVGRLVVEPAITEALERGTAAVVAFMSNHGLAHAVVTAEHARAIGQLFPDWVRVLANATPLSP